jgi:hypothetical protein
MLSIVVPRYGLHNVPLAQCGIHQNRNGVWHWCSEISVRRRLITVPPLVAAG